MLDTLPKTMPDGSTIADGSTFVMKDGKRKLINLDNFFFDISSELAVEQFNKKFFQGDLIKLEKGLSGIVVKVDKLSIEALIDAKVKAHINSLDIKSVVNSTVESKVSDNDGNELGMKNNSMLNFSGDETIKVELDPISQTLKIMMREKPDDFAAKIQPFLDAIYESMNQMHQAAMVGKK